MVDAPEYDHRDEHGSITSNPNKHHPKHDPQQIKAQAEVERLREGNRKLLDELNRIKAWAQKQFPVYEGKQFPWDN